MRNTLLITGAIDITKNIPCYTKLTDTQERLSQYIDSVEYAITNYKIVKNIIFCENTGFLYDYTKLKNLAQYNDKTLEILSFVGDNDTTRTKGKGYGEGEIVKYAIENSKLINKNDSFIKLTGRLKISNFDHIIGKGTNTFIQPTIEKYKKNEMVYTAIYQVDLKFYKKHLLNCYQNVDDKNNRYLEHTFYEELSKHKIYRFIEYPNTIGISGSSGDNYNKNRKSLFLSKIYLLLGMYNVNKNCLTMFFVNTYYLLKGFK